MELIHEYEAHFQDDQGALYLMRAYGQERADGTWTGWLEFVPTLGDGEPLTTGQETSQPNREALAYWGGRPGADLLRRGVRAGGVGISRPA